MLKLIRNYSLYLAWLVALFSMIISLYSSEILKMPICHLCWYQRMGFYPLALILGIAAYCNDTKIVKYALPLSLISMLFAIYQYALQMLPNFAPIALCGLGPSCTEAHFKLWGFITYPFLSFLAAFLISFLLLLSIKSKHGIQP